MSSLPAARTYGLFGVRSEDVVPPAPHVLDHWSFVVGARELNHPTKSGIVDRDVLVDDQGPYVFGTASAALPWLDSGAGTSAKLAQALHPLNLVGRALWQHPRILALMHLSHALSRVRPLWFRFILPRFI